MTVQHVCYRSGVGVSGKPIVDLKFEAGCLQTALKANRRDAMNDDNALDIQALCLAEEAGELVGAYRRYAGKARRPGSLEEVKHEIADVAIVLAIFAEMLGVDLNEAIDEKLAIIWSRGWKEEVA